MIRKNSVVCVVNYQREVLKEIKIEKKTGACLDRPSEREVLKKIKKKKKSLLEAVIKKGKRKTLFLRVLVQVPIQVQLPMIQTVKKKIVMNPHQEMKILEEENQIKVNQIKVKRKRKK